MLAQAWSKNSRRNSPCLKCHFVACAVACPKLLRTNIITFTNYSSIDPVEEEENFFQIERNKQTSYVCDFCGSLSPGEISMYYMPILVRMAGKLMTDGLKEINCHELEPAQVRTIDMADNLIYQQGWYLSRLPNPALHPFIMINETYLELLGKMLTPDEGYSHSMARSSVDPWQMWTAGNYKVVIPGSAPFHEDGEKVVDPGETYRLAQDVLDNPDKYMYIYQNNPEINAPNTQHYEPYKTSEMTSRIQCTKEFKELVVQSTEYVNRVMIAMGYPLGFQTCFVTSDNDTMLEPLLYREAIEEDF